MHQATSGLRQQLKGVLGAVLLCSCLSSFAGAAEDRDYADAVQSYSAGRTSVAFGQFAALADRGDADAARIALFMVTHGAVLYGKHWDALPQQVGHWTNLAKSTAQARTGAPFDATALQRADSKKTAQKDSRPAIKTIAFVSR